MINATVNIAETFEIVKPKARFKRNVVRKTRESDNPKESAINLIHPRARNTNKAHVTPGRKVTAKKESKIPTKV